MTHGSADFRVHFPKITMYSCIFVHVIIMYTLSFNCDDRTLSVSERHYSLLIMCHLYGRVNQCYRNARADFVLEPEQTKRSS